MQAIPNVAEKLIQDKLRKSYRMLSFDANICWSHQNLLTDLNYAKTSVAWFCYVRIVKLRFLAAKSPWPDGVYWWFLDCLKSVFLSIFSLEILSCSYIKTALFCERVRWDENSADFREKGGLLADHSSYETTQSDCDLKSDVDYSHLNKRTVAAETPFICVRPKGSRI